MGSQKETGLPPRDISRPRQTISAAGGTSISLPGRLHLLFPNIAMRGANTRPRKPTYFGKRSHSSTAGLTLLRRQGSNNISARQPAKNGANPEAWTEKDTQVRPQPKSSTPKGTTTPRGHKLINTITKEGKTPPRLSKRGFQR